MTLTSLIPEIICLLFSIYYLRSVPDKYWKNFIYYLTFIVLVETIGYVQGISKINNHWLYNFELIIEYFFLMSIFRNILKRSVTTWFWINYGTLFFVVVFLLESHYHFYYTSTGNNPDHLNKISRLLVSVLFVIASGWYFYELLESPDFEKLSAHPGFWLVAGIFIFYFVTAVTVTFFPQLIRIHIKNNLYVSHIMFSALNIILYGFWSYSFRCRKMQAI